jgi:hypothetical protein
MNLGLPAMNELLVKLNLPFQYYKLTGLGTHKSSINPDEEKKFV